MAELTVEIPEEVAEEARQLKKEELNFLVTESLRERLPEFFMSKLAERVREKSTLTDEHIKELSNDLKRRVAKRHGL